jgi:hypothetical protein
MDFDDFLRLIKGLDQHAVDYVLIGGVALSVHGLVRATEDIDLFVRPDADNIERLRRALRAVWDDPEIERITTEDLAGEYPTIRYVPPAGAPVVDLLSRLGTEFRFEDIESEQILVEGVLVRVATPRALYRMKKDTVRPIDRADAAALREKFALEGD